MEARELSAALDAVNKRTDLSRSELTSRAGFSVELAL
tara:strand:+ start:152 stop:262 length:111 start_codon:yes stop_codon:yes gene_type:complete